MTKPQRSFTALFVVGVLIWWSPILATTRLACGGGEHTHILLILPITAALILSDLKARRNAFQPCVGTAVLLLSFSLCLVAFGYLKPAFISDELRLSVSMFGLVVWWLGSFLLCFGVGAFRHFLFPLCLLFWLVPFPAVALTSIIHFLQEQSAFAARMLFLAINVPARQAGVVVSIPNLEIEVAPQCSSIRSSLMLVISTMVLGHLFLRSWKRQLILTAATIPLSILKNGLRIVVIAELGTRVDIGFLDGRLHHNGGIVFFAIALAAVAALLLGLQRGETQKPVNLISPSSLL